MKPLQLLFAVGALTASCALAQDFVSVAPNAKVLKDDGRIRVIDYQPKAGDKLPMHSHPTMVVYLVKGGATRFTLEDGRTTEGKAETGAVLINPPVAHSQEHITDSHAILIEIAEGTTFESPSPATDLLLLAPDHCKVLKETDCFAFTNTPRKRGTRSQCILTRPTSST